MGRARDLAVLAALDIDQVDGFDIASADVAIHASSATSFDL